jgi:hypothetical protein
VTNAIASLLDFPSERHQLGENGKRLASRCYSWKAIAEKLVCIYIEVIKTDCSNPLTRKHLAVGRVKNQVSGQK